MRLHHNCLQINTRRMIMRALHAIHMSGRRRQGLKSSAFNGDSLSEALTLACREACVFCLANADYWQAVVRQQQREAAVQVSRQYVACST